MAALLPADFWPAVERVLCEASEPCAVQLVRRVGDEERQVDALPLNGIKVRQALGVFVAPPPELQAALAVLAAEGGDIGEVSQGACKALAVAARVWIERRLRELSGSESKLRVRVRGASVAGVSKTVQLGGVTEETALVTVDPSSSEAVSDARALVALAVEGSLSLTRASSIVHDEFDRRALGHNAMLRDGYQELLTEYKAHNGDLKHQLKLKDERIAALELRAEQLQDKFADKMQETRAIEGVIAADAEKTSQLKEAWSDTLAMVGGAFTIHSLAKAGLSPASLPIIEWASANPQALAKLADPRVMRLLADPELVRVITSPAVLALLSDPDFLAEVENPQTRRQLLKGLSAYAAKAAAGA